eukprot:gene2166-9019_t
MPPVKAAPTPVAAVRIALATSPGSATAAAAAVARLPSSVPASDAAESIDTMRGETTTSSPPPAAAMTLRNSSSSGDAPEDGRCGAVMVLEQNADGVATTFKFCDCTADTPEGEGVCA